MEREQAIEQLEQFQQQCYQEMLHNGSLYMCANEYYKKHKAYYKNLQEVEVYFKKNMERMIERNHDRGYSHVSSEMLDFEYNVFQFAQKNPELWMIMTQYIYDGNPELNHYEGYCFMDSFIHNGVWDDWELHIAQKDDETYFVFSEEEFLAKGFKMTYLSQKSMQKVLDTYCEKNHVKKMKM